MSGFESLEQAIITTAASTLTAEQASFSDEKLDDQAALELVLGDVQRAESYVQSKNMTVDWERADNNYRAVGLPKNWPGTESMRAGLSVPVVMEAVEKLLPTLMLAFFSDARPFLLEKRGKTSDAAARAWEKVIEWAIKESGFKEEIRKTLKGALLYGFAVARWGWCTASRVRKHFQYEQGGKNVVKKETPYDISHPTFENIEIRKALVDPALREQDVRKARYAVVQCFTTAGGLDGLRADPGYKNIPTREELKQILGSNSEAATDALSGHKNLSWRDNQAAPEKDIQSADPLLAPLELLEYITPDGRVITVLQRKIVIRNDSPFDRTTLLSSAFIDVPGAMYGFGVSKLLAGEQYLQVSVLNAWLDVVALQLNPGFTSETGLQTSSQNVKLTPGKILIGPKLTPIPIPSVGPEALNVLQTSENRAARRVGANGGSDMPTQAMRTAEGVNAFGQDVVNKMQYFIEIFSDQVFIPAIEAFIDVCKENLQPEDINRILSDVDGKAYSENILDFYNAQCNITVLASTKLAQRRNAANLLPLLLNLASAPATQQGLTAQGMKFNYAELLDEAVDLTGWDVDSLVIPASKEEIARAMQMQAPQPSKAQIDAQSKQQDQQNVLQQIEENGIMRAGVQVVKHVLDSSQAEGANGPV